MNLIMGLFHAQKTIFIMLFGLLDFCQIISTKFLEVFFFLIYSDINFNLLRCLSKYLTATLLKDFYSEAISLRTICFVRCNGFEKGLFFSTQQF